jgi:hypothetical protein
VAGDLIPPPSPAGKPPPDPVVEPSAQVEAAAQLDATPAPSPRTPPPFRGRFGFVWGALAGIAVCAVGTFALLVAAPNESGPMLAADWSSWEPDSTKMVDGAQEIADHVGVQYKLDGGEQLVSVRSSELELGGEPIGVAVRPAGGEIQFLEGDGLLYILNGLGPSGRMSTGKPTRERGRLLMREALELALYSFRYLDDVTMVAVLMPQTARQAEANAGGAAAAPQTNAIFYRPGDLLEQLRVPLDRTLSPRTPRPGTMTKTEALRVDDLTLRNLFLASVQPLQSDRNYLVLVEPETVE